MEQRAYLVAGLQYGDEGKGSIVDYLVRKTGADMVVRYNGGPQAAHNVVTPDGRHHTFAQLGSGSFAGARTYLSRFMLIEPMAFMNEFREFHSRFGFKPKVYVEDGCPIITPMHWRLNRRREEMRGNERHGSCGMGVGELRRDELSGASVLRVGQLRDARTARATMRCIQIEKSHLLRAHGETEDLEMDWESEYGNFAEAVEIVPNDNLHRIASGGGDIVFEGAQGMLLDERHGYAPHNTWTDITFTNALDLLEGSGFEVKRIGVSRSYCTRHGAGPFPSEDFSVGWPDHNTAGPWQGEFRQGLLDLRLLEYAVRRIGGIDTLALTHLDRASADGLIRVSDRQLEPGVGHLFCRPTFHYEQRVVDHLKIAESVSEELITSRGPSAADKEWRSQ